MQYRVYSSSVNEFDRFSGGLRKLLFLHLVLGQVVDMRTYPQPGLQIGADTMVACFAIVVISGHNMQKYLIQPNFIGIYFHCKVFYIFHLCQQIEQRRRVKRRSLEFYHLRATADDGR